MLPIREFSDQMCCVFATLNGLVKKVPLSAFSNVRSSGIIAITMKDDDRLVGTVLVKDEQDVMLFTSAGKAIRFQASDIRETGRTSQGVIGIRMKSGHKVISLLAVEDDKKLLIVTEKIEDFNRIGRGGQGVIAIIASERNGSVIRVVSVSEQNDFFLITNNGSIIRMHAESVSIVGRNTQGVRLIQLSGEDLVVGCQVLEKEEDQDLDDVDVGLDGNGNEDVKKAELIDGME